MEEGEFVVAQNLLGNTWFWLVQVRSQDLKAGSYKLTLLCEQAQWQQKSIPRNNWIRSLLLVLSLSGIASIADGFDNQQLNEIVAAIRLRQWAMDSIDSYRLNYVCKEYRSEQYWKTLFLADKGSSSEKDIMDFQDIVYDTSVELAKKGDRLFYSLEGQYIVNGRLTERVYKSRAAFDGQKTICNNNIRSKNYSLSRRASRARIREDPFEFVMEDWLLNGLEQAEKDELDSFSLESLEEVNTPRGTRIRVELRFPIGKTVVYFDPAFGYTITRFALFYHSENKLTTEVKDVEYREVAAGIILPIRAKKIHYWYEQGHRRVSSSTEFQVLDQTFDAAKVPDDLFVVKVPPGAKVWNEDLQIWEKNLELEGKLFDEVAKDALDLLQEVDLGREDKVISRPLKVSNVHKRSLQPAPDDVKSKVLTKLLALLFVLALVAVGGVAIIRKFMARKSAS